MKARVLVVGYGNVGRRSVELISERRTAIERRWGTELHLVGVVRRHPWQSDDPVPEELRFSDALSAIRLTRPDILVELIGGIDEAREIILTAFEVGAHVVTANKAVLAVHGPELRAAAVENGHLLLAEASVGGAIPLLRTLHTTLAADRIERVLGVWNGTCNYILTEMEENGTAFADVLAEAQRLGYAEADPTLDIGGGDTAHKACVLAQLSFGAQPELDEIRYRGITPLIPEDFTVAEQMGLRPKMIGLLQQQGERLVFYVGPALLPRSHPVAELEGVRNGIWIAGDAVDGVFLSGPGAGPVPTAVAVLGDIIEAARMSPATEDEDAQTPVIERWGTLLDEDAVPALVPHDELRFACYLRLQVPDRPGVLGKIATALGDHGICIESMMQPWRHPSDAVPIYMTIDEAPIGDLERALEAMRGFDFAVGEPLWMPILEREGRG